MTWLHTDKNLMLKHIGQPNLTALFAKNIKSKVEQFATIARKNL